MKARQETIHAKGINIRLYATDFENEYISLTDIAKYRNGDDPRFVIQNWMRNKNTVELLAVWECLHNPDFNRVQFEAVKQEAGLNRFVLTPSKWIETTNAIGIVSKAGRYGGTYADEADLLNVALFGQTAQEWRKNHPDEKGNMRDYASINQLLVLSNLESYNAILIQHEVPQPERLVLLRETAIKQLSTLGEMEKSSITSLSVTDNKV